jgi:acetyl-CoA carboxylase biotin carboxyl carrier protein
MSDMTADEQARATMARLAEDVLPTLIDRLTHSDLGELEVRQDGWRIRLRRPIVEMVAGGATSEVGGPLAGGADGPAARAISAAPHSVAERAARPDPPRDVVTSPAVGYFVPRDGVDPGSSLREGDSIGHIDVLGVRHEIVSPHDGTLREFEVEAGAAVEYGEPIARVEANV